MTAPRRGRAWRRNQMFRIRRRVCKYDDCWATNRARFLNRHSYDARTVARCISRLEKTRPLVSRNAREREERKRMARKKVQHIDDDSRHARRRHRGRSRVYRVLYRPRPGWVRWWGWRDRGWRTYRMYPTQRAAAQAVDALNRSRLFEYQRGGRRVKREAEEIVLRDNEIFEWRGSYIYGPCKLTITTNGKGEQEVEIEAADQAKRGGQVKRK